MKQIGARIAHPPMRSRLKSIDYLIVIPTGILCEFETQAVGPYTDF